MPVTTLLRRASLAVIDYRCAVGPHDAPFTERHGAFSLSYVRQGSFGCHGRGRFFDLVAGSILVGYPGDEYLCTHEHALGDECLSFQFAPELVDAIGGPGEAWRSVALPPLPQLVVLGELAEAAARGSSDLGLDEVAVMLASGFVSSVSGGTHTRARLGARDRRRAVEVALWIDAHAGEPIAL